MSEQDSARLQREIDSASNSLGRYILLLDNDADVLMLNDLVDIRIGVKGGVDWVDMTVSTLQNIVDLSKPADNHGRNQGILWRCHNPMVIVEKICAESIVEAARGYLISVGAISTR